ncbi:MAG: TolC family protein [Bacteroidales bacterium]|nr:TolC family protein [Bacteroidales bacterium]
MKKTITIIAIMLGCAAMYAQSLTLDSCKVLALRNNAAVKNAALDVAAAQEVKKQAFTKYFPNVSVMAGGYYAANPLFEYGIDDIENANARQWLHNLYYEYGAAIGLPDRITLCENGVMAGAMVVQPVYMGGQIVNGNKLAKVGVEAAELKAQLTEDQITQQVEETYWQTVSLIEKRKTLRQAISFLDTLHRDVTAAAEAGLVTRNDILKVELKQNEMRSNMLKVNNGITLSTMLLCQMIGMEYSENLILTDTVSNETGSTASPEADFADAVRRRKESQLLDLQVSAEELKKKMALGETLPHLTIGGTASYGNLVFDHFSANALAFTTLQIPLTSWWETAHKIRQQNFLIQKAENERADYVAKMELETRQAWCNVEEAKSQVTLAESSVRSAESNLADTKSNFDAGLVPVSDLLEAQTLLLQAQNQRTDALIDLKIKAEHYKTLTSSH